MVFAVLILMAFMFSDITLIKAVVALIKIHGLCGIKKGRRFNPTTSGNRRDR